MSVKQKTKMLHRATVRHTWYAVNLAALALAFFGSLFVFFAVHAEGPDAMSLYRATHSEMQPTAQRLMLPVIPNSTP